MFYVISKEKQEEVNEFDIKYFGDVVPKNFPVSYGNGHIGVETKYIPATSEDYDRKFISFMDTISPIFKIPQFLDYHYNNYSGEKNEFISQIKYAILPIIEKRANSSLSKLINDWIEMKNPKENITSYTINTGNINAPVQIQQKSSNSNQSQNLNYNSENVKEFFSVIKSDIQKMDQKIREDFDLEIGYAVKQLEKGNDITTQLFNLGSLIKEVGLSMFTNLISSGIFEIIKPSLGIS